jgi:hypothetical protein
MTRPWPAAGWGASIAAAAEPTTRLAKDHGRTSLTITGSNDEARASVGWDLAATESLSRRRAPKFHEAGLAATGDNDEALAAASHRGGWHQPRPSRAGHQAGKRPQAPVDGLPGPADDPVAELLRLAQEAAMHAAKLVKRLDPVVGRPTILGDATSSSLPGMRLPTWSSVCSPFSTMWRVIPTWRTMIPTAATVAIPSAPAARATRSRSAAGEMDLGWNENVNQLHLDQGDPLDRSGEVNLATTEGIDQRFAWTGSRTDREVDPFPYDEPRRQGFTEPVSNARAETEQALRKRGVRSRSEGNVVEVLRWRR